MRRPPTAIPARLQSFGVYRGEVAPDFLGVHDHGWLRDLMDQFDRLAGQPERLLEERLRRPMDRPVPRGKLRMAVHVLRQLGAPVRVGSPSPAEVRRALAQAATAARRTGESAVRAVEAVSLARMRVCDRLDIAHDSLDLRAYGDLPGARPLRPLPAGLTAPQVSRTVNHALACGLLSRSVHVELTVADEVRRVVRYAQLRGLICTVSPAHDAGTRLEISGPLSLFRRTRLYARALSSLLGQLSMTRKWRLQARLRMNQAPDELRFRLDERDRLLGDPGPDRFDSEVERRFAADFERRWPDWELRHEPAAFAAGDSLVFPDFELVRATGVRKRWFVEIVGFWTAEYLERKLSRLKAVGRSDLIVCIDARRACEPSDSPLPRRVVAYKGRVDVAALAPYLTP